MGSARVATRKFYFIETVSGVLRKRETQTSGSMENLDYLSAALAAILTYAIYTAIWRLYFSPIAHFPGPRLAALTHG